MRLLKLAFTDPNSTHFGDGEDNHFFLHSALGIGGIGAAVKGYSNYYGSKSKIDDSKYFFKTHDNMKKSVKAFNNSNSVDKTMSHYMSNYKLNTPQEAVEHFNANKSVYNKAIRGKWLGRLGLLSSGYGAYNLLQHNAYHKEI